MSDEPVFNQDDFINKLINEVMKDLSVVKLFAELKRVATNLSTEIVEKLTYNFILNALQDVLKENNLTLSELAQNIVSQNKFMNYTDNMLRWQLRYRRAHGRDIEPELQEELIRRFPQYDPEQKKILRSANKVDYKSKSDKSLRLMYFYKKRHNLEIPQEMNAELILRFPDWDPETQMFKDNDKNKVVKDFSNCSNENLRGIYSYRKQRNRKIEPELNAELARRFPGWNSETQTFARAKVSDITKLSNDALYSRYKRIKQKGGEIDDELDAELTRRFSRYDPKTKTIEKFKKIDFSENNDVSLRALYRYNKRHNIKIGVELNAELIRRFPGYDPKTETFGNKKGKSLAELSDARLRGRYWYKKIHGQEINDELNDELSRRFPCYDPKEKIFTGKRRDNNPDQPGAKADDNHPVDPVSVADNVSNESKSVSVPPTKVVDLKTKSPKLSKKSKGVTSNSDIVLPLFSNKVKNGDTYSLFFYDGVNQKCLLKGAIRPYELYLFDEKAKIAIVKKAGVNNVFSLFLINLKKGTVQSTHKYGFQTCAYVSQTHEFFINEDKNFMVISHKHMIPTYVITVPINAEVLKATSKPKYTRFIHNSGGESGYPLMIIATQENFDKQQQKIKYILNSADAPTRPQKSMLDAQLYDITNSINVEKMGSNMLQNNIKKRTPSIKTPQPVPEIDKSQLSYVKVVVQPVKKTSDGVYNDIYVNGQLLRKNHLNTEVKLFCDDTILAIRGTIVDNKKYPESPIWLVYDMNLNLRPPLSTTANQRYIYVANIVASQDCMRLALSNNSFKFVETARMKKLAETKRFVIERAKQKHK